MLFRSFEFTVSDGELTDSETVTIIINAVNDAPIATSTSAVTDEDVSVTVDLIGSDIDNEDIVYLLDQDSADGFVDIDGSQATFTPDENFNGTTTFTYLVTDGELTSSSAMVIITVNPVNDAPILSEIDDQSIDEDGIFIYDIQATDIDGDAITYSVVIISGDASYDLTDTQLTVTPDLDWNGDVQVSVAVFDGELADSDSFTLTVNPVNDPPYFITEVLDNAIDRKSVVEGKRVERGGRRSMKKKKKKKKRQ